MKPFPYPLNLGTDIVHLPRITRLLHQNPSYLEKFTRRILCESEREDFRRRFNVNINITNTHTHTHTNDDINTSISKKKMGSNSGPETKIKTKTIISTDMARWLAGRFAAKEAAKKAAPFGAAGVGWKDVVVRVPGSGSGPGSSSGSSFSSGSGSVSTGLESTNTSTATNTRTSAKESGRPEIVYLNQDREGGGRVGRLSISHDGEYVVATVLAVDHPQ